MNPHKAKPKPTPRKSQDRKSQDRPGVEETRAAEATTVAWMLTTLATLGAEFAALGMWLLLQFVDREQVAGQILALPALLLFTALVSGVMGLILLVVVRRVRQTLPPRSVFLVAGTICSLPPFLLIVQAFMV